MDKQKALLEAYNDYKAKENEIAMKYDKEYDGSDIERFYQEHTILKETFDGSDISEELFKKFDVLERNSENNQVTITIYDDIGKKVANIAMNSKEGTKLDKAHSKYGVLNVEQIRRR